MNCDGIQLEKLNRGLVAVKVKNGIFLSWRLMLWEVDGAEKERLTGANFIVYRNGKKIALVTESTNYLDKEGTAEDFYSVAPVSAEKEQKACEAVRPWQNEYLDLPLKKPADGVTPKGDSYSYRANDMSVGDVDGDGEYEYIVKWDPDNSQDVSIKGYTGSCLLDCYRLDGTLLWRLDMGPNIRAGAHYTQFMVYDFDGDGMAEMAVKTAPGTNITVYGKNGEPVSKKYIQMLPEDLAAGYGNEDNYVCSSEDYRKHLVEMFMDWHTREEVRNGQWPSTLEECFGQPVIHSYPLKKEAAEELVEYFINDYAPKRSPKNVLSEFEGFIYEGPEYLTMFSGMGEELETVRFPFLREDDGLRWGDYALPRIEPCNRVDRFLSGVAYLDGKRPSLIVCRGYYTRMTMAAYDFREGHFKKRFMIDSGHVPMNNPFCDNPHILEGSDQVYGCLAGQGNHSLSTADVDGDGCDEIIYGAAVIDHDGSILYSSYDKLPDGTRAKLGHGDAMHVARIDPDYEGFQIFNVFEGAEEAPYGWALRDAATGRVLFGEYAEEDLGRCMIGDIDPDSRGLQVWVREIFDCHGKKLELPLIGTNMCIRFAADMSTQIIGETDYLNGVQTGVIHDYRHGVMLRPEETATNNGTKGNPCLVADIFGDFREELLVRLKDSSAIRIYTGTEVTKHKLFTLMHDSMYRCGVAWQNNCYNQPCYTKFYYASDMDCCKVLAESGWKQ